MELKAQDLRIGNRIRIAPKIQKVLAIYDDNFIETESYYVDINDPFNTPKPILLTEEWLSKLGLMKYRTVGDKGYYSDQDRDLRITLVDGIAHCSMGNDDHGIIFRRARYIHEIQNIWWAINSEELELSKE